MAYKLNDAGYRKILLLDAIGISQSATLAGMVVATIFIYRFSGAPAIMFGLFALSAFIAYLRAPLIDLIRGDIHSVEGKIGKTKKYDGLKTDYRLFVESKGGRREFYCRKVDWLNIREGVLYEIGYMPLSKWVVSLHPAGATALSHSAQSAVGKGVAQVPPFHKEEPLGHLTPSGRSGDQVGYQTNSGPLFASQGLIANENAGRLTRSQIGAMCLTLLWPRGAVVGTWLVLGYHISRESMWLGTTMLALATGLAAYILVPFVMDLMRGKTLCERGAINKEIRKGKSTYYYVEVNGMRLECRHSLWQELNDGSIYDIHYAPATKWVVAFDMVAQ